MKKLFLKITILVVLFLIPKMVFGNVVINEVLYDPTGTDTSKEYVRLYNNSDADISLTNWDLDPSSANYFTFPSFTLSAKSFVNIHIGASGTNNLTDLYDNGSTNMSNTAGPIALFNSTTHSKTTIIDYVEYGTAGQTNESKAVDAGIWIAGTFIPDAQEGKAIKLASDGLDTNSPSDWIETIPSIAQQTQESSSQQTSQEGSATTSTPNTPPIAEAGDNIIAFVNQEIRLDGSKSSDPENNELQYSWNTGDGNSSDHQIITHKYQYPGTYLATLTVFDGRYYNTDTITIKIQNQGITINEFMANPSGKDEEEEWIEIYNDADEIMDISGWQLDDTASGSKAFTFPQNTLIAPKSYVVFARQVTGIALNNDEDSVRLLMPEGIVFQEINYENPPIGKSSARTSDGFVWSEPTPGTTNIILASASLSENKKFIYQNPIKPEIVQQPENYVINYQNADQIEIKEGYNEIPTTNGQLASIKQPAQNKTSINFVLIIVILVLGASVVGIALVKFRKKIP